MPWPGLDRPGPPRAVGGIRVGPGPVHPGRRPGQAPVEALRRLQRTVRRLARLVSGSARERHRFAHAGLLLSTWLQQLGAKGGTLRVEPMMKARVEMDGHSNTRGALSALVRAKLLGQGAAASWPHNGRSDQA